MKYTTAVEQRQAELEAKFGTWAKTAKPGAVIPPEFETLLAGAAHRRRGGRPQKYARVFSNWAMTPVGYQLRIHHADNNRAINQAKHTAKNWLKDLGLQNRWHLFNLQAGSGWALVALRRDSGPVSEGTVE